jgi:DNA-binding beta-propeller fold protein YncE
MFVTVSPRILKPGFLCLAAALALATALEAKADFLVGNTSGNNVSRYDGTGSYVGEFIASGSGGLVSPDDLTWGPDGNLYVSSSSSNTTGSILRYDGQTGAYLGVFAEGGGLARPYGSAFGPDGNLYVASFRSDQILRYNGSTGAFLGVFAQGNGTASGLLNGPNDLLFGPDGTLYVTTQGSVADGSGGITYSFASQTLRYDIQTGAGQIFAPEPVPTAGGAGYISMLGLGFGPDGRLYTSDYAGGIRSYDSASGALLQTIDTGALFATGGATTIGNFAFAADGDLYAAVFNGDGHTQAGMARCAVSTGVCQLYIDGSGVLDRPIGVAVIAVPEPAPWALFCLGLLGLAVRKAMQVRQDGQAPELRA